MILLLLLRPVPRLLAFTARGETTSYLYSFAEADAGKTAHWAICWENGSMQRGPCSAASSWTIPG